MICRNCGGKISKNANVCQFCAYPIYEYEPYDNQYQQAFRRKNNIILGGFIAFIILFIILVASLLFSGYSNAQKNQKYSELSIIEYKEQCQAVTYEQIARDPKAMEDQLVTFTGEIIQVSGSTYRIDVTKTKFGYTDTILFEYNNTGKRILENDIVTIWGRSKGFTTYKSVIGAKVTLPDIDVKYLTINPNRKNNEINDAASNSSDTSNSHYPNNSLEIEEKEIVNQDGIIITTKGIEYTTLGNVKLKILIENNTDTDLTFQIRNESINDYMVDTSLSEDVCSGKKSNTSIEFSHSYFEKCGIDVISYIEFSFHIFRSDNWKDYLNTEMIKIENLASSTYEQIYDDSGEVLYDQNDIKIIGKGISYDSSYLGPHLVLYIENNTSQNITVQSKDESINGFMVKTSLSEKVSAGKKSITNLTIYESSLESNSISEINSIEMSFSIFLSESLDKIVDTPSISISF